ncbi:MAG: hypothetical protein EHM64_02960 [Ignavibacteriae bacterium]|nr:MAG: hypothetical protein EHM64_02960 [Ignavibacteriota bacterium]
MKKNPLEVMKRIAWVLAETFLLCLFFVSCGEEIKNNPISTSTNPNRDTVSSGTVKQPGSLQKAYCADGRNLVFRYYWENQNLYQLNSGKSMGVMYDGDMSRNHNYIAQYGCNTICIDDVNSIGQLLSYGYLAENIFIILHPGAWDQKVDAAVQQGVKSFYIDEPCSYHLESLVQTCAPYIASRGGTLTISESEFDYLNWYVYGGRGYIGALINLALSTSPSPFVSCHTHFDRTTVLGVTFTMDPRDQWSYIMSRVPNLFKTVIIKSRQSPEDLGLLFGHAKNIGINKVLYFPFMDNGTTYAGIENAIVQGWYAHWILQLQKERLQYWCCPDIYWDPQECSLNSWHYTGYTQWQ